MTNLIILSPILLILTIYLLHDKLFFTPETRQQKRDEEKKVEYFNTLIIKPGENR